MKPRLFFLALALTVVLSFAVVGAGCYWVLAQSPLALLSGGVQRSPMAAAFIPKQASVMISLLVNPDRLEAFGELIARPQNRRQSQREFHELEQSLLAKTGLNYRRSVQPWLGEEITLAVTSLDYDRNAANGSQPGYLLIVETRDPQLSKEFLQVSYAESAIAGDFDLVFDTYQGVNLTYKRPLKAIANSNLLANAIVGNYVLFANHPKVLREALNSLQAPDLSLSRTLAYQEALKTIQEPRIGLFYVNFPTLSAWLSQLPKPEQGEIAQTLTVAFSLKSQGLVAQTALTGVTGAENQAAQFSQPGNSLNRIPANSLLTASGKDLNHFWQQIETGLVADSPLQQTLHRFIDHLQKPLGLDLPQDVFQWVQGEYSLALVPDPQGQQPAWVFVAQRLPEIDVDKAIAHWDDLAQEQGYNVDQLPLLGQTVTAWTQLKTASQNQISSLAAQVSGVHTRIDETEIFATSLEALSQVLLANQQPLIESKKFQQAIKALPVENNGYFYLDWDQSEPILQDKFPFLRVLELSIKPLFKNLRSLTISSEGNVNGIRRATAYLNLGVRERT